MENVQSSVEKAKTFKVRRAREPLDFLNPSFLTNGWEAFPLLAFALPTVHNFAKDYFSFRLTLL